MKVIVLKSDGSFYSTLAFTVHYDKWKTEYFVLNEYSQFERIFKYNQGQKHIEKKAFVKDYNLGNGDDFITIGNYEGYSKFINDKELLNRIRKGEKNIFDTATMGYYESLIDSFVKDEDNIVKDKEDCQCLTDFTEGFHDAVVTDFVYSKADDVLTIELEGVWGLEKLYLNFDGNIIYHIEDDYEYQYFHYVLCPDR